jgi:peroxiredoxin
MKTSISFLLALCAAVASVAVLILVRADGAAPATQPATEPVVVDPGTLIGKPAPAFTLKDLDGNTHSLADARGHVLVMEFWATWCASCPVAQKHLMDVAKQHQADGLVVWTIQTDDDPALAAKFLKEKGLTLPALLDIAPPPKSQDEPLPSGPVGVAYLVGDMPQTVVIDRQGIIRDVQVGYYPDKTPALLEQSIAAALARP